MTRTRPWAVVDAFTERPFAGNPAAVLLLERNDGLDDKLLAAIAAEANLSETAFLVPRDDDRWDLRWFTPTTEVALCGHATLASAHWLLARLQDRDTVGFATRSGALTGIRSGDGVRIDLPALPAAPVDDDGLRRAVTLAVGVQPVELLETQQPDTDERRLVVVLDDDAAVRGLAPDLEAVARLPTGGVIVTARGDADDVDVVSRYFTPQHGIPEDPVTGSAHCTLGPLWCDRLGLDAIVAEQVSPRGGRLLVRPAGDRVELTGAAVTVVEGHLTLP